MAERFNPWADYKDLAAEILVHGEDIQYKKILNSQQLLYLGEAHDRAHQTLRSHLERSTPQLKAAGITYYAIEAPEEGKAVLAKLIDDTTMDFSSLCVCPDINNQEEYRRIIRAFAKVGIPTIPIDTNDDFAPYQKREDELETNLATIFTKDPKARVALLIGGGHTYQGTNERSFRWLGGRIARRDISSATIMYIVAPKLYPKIINSAFELAGVTREYFMLDVRPFRDLPGIPLHWEYVDYLVNLPVDSKDKSD